jgi:hypothetical protein
MATELGKMPWPSVGPNAWPDPPAELTVSALREIEACPRRWALSSADYPSIWGDRGYPARANVKALAGTVVHTVLETVTKELVKAGCPSVLDATAVMVLQRLGGWSKVVGLAIDQLVARCAANPRLSRLSDYFSRSLRAQVPELRSRVQAMLARRVLLSKSKPVSTGVSRRERGPLGPGVYCELDLHVPRLGWRGRTDLLSLTLDSCEITDFKTGEPADEHAFQLRVYATLWNRDDILNPTARLATQLVLAHPHGDVTLPAPTAQEISDIEVELAARGAAARKAIEVHPPEAKPSLERCRYCGVRQLCDAYWQPDTQQRLADERIDETKSYVDVSASVHRQHGPKSWDIFIGVGANRVKGLLRTAGDLELWPGQELRILDAAQSLDDSDQSGVRCLTVGQLSEIYAVGAPA